MNVVVNSRLALAVTVLSLVGAGITAYLTLEHGQGNSPACIVGHGCSVIASSKYAHIGSLPTASLGLFAYLVLALVSGSRMLQPPEEIERTMRYLALGIAFAGAAFSGWLMYLAISVLHATCIWCISSAVTITLIFVLSLIDVRMSTRTQPALL